MKATVEGGVLIVLAETGLDAYALAKWKADSIKSENGRVYADYILIGECYPKEPRWSFRSL